MNSINITIFGLVFIILLCIVYFCRRRVDYLENKVYSLLIISSLAGTLLELITFLFVKLNGDVTFGYILFVKFLFVNFLIWITCFTLYFGVISLNDDKKSKSLIKKVLLLVGILCIISTLLPIDIEKRDGLLLPKGISVYTIYMECGICILIMIGLLIKNIRRLKDKKFWPLALIFVVFSVMIFLQQKFSNVLLVNPMAIFITFLMYFTIENPDVAMIEQLNVEKAKAEKANLAKTEFLSNMSHEIRTPLNAIVGFSNLLLENKDLPSDAKEEVNDIIMASDNLLEIVNGILDISKIEANKLEIINNEYSFPKLMQELITLTKGRLGDKPIEFKTSIDPSIPEVLYGDAQRVKQVCVNILTNAVKYTKEGFIELKVSSVIKADVCRLIISVEDSGIGIKQENINKLFTKFERMDIEKNATIEGTGLGLAITKMLMDLMHGKIIVQSVYGKGSKFTICLDQKIVKNPTLKVEVEPKEEVKVSLSKKVLLVDDNKINLKVGEKLLQTYGLEPDLVESGAACLEALAQGKTYDLILLDDMMPKLSGVETLQEIKKTYPDFAVPVVALTANALTGMREKYLKDGFDDYLAKPIDKNELNRVINKYLNKE